MRPVNLIPPEQRRGEHAPTRTGPIAYVLVGALGILLVGVYLSVSAGNKISDREAEVATLEQDLASVEARVAALRSFADFANVEQARTQTISSLAQSRFDWERVLRELALVIPTDVSLVSLSGSLDGGTEGETTTTGAVAAPQLTMAGCAADHEAVAGLVAALRDIDGVTRVGLTNSQEVDSSAGGDSSGQGGGAECQSGAMSFELVAVFDEVPLDAAASTPATPAPAPATEELG